MYKKPSVTELINLLNKPALIKWANKLGLNGISVDDYKKNKLTSGTNIHNQIERLLKYGESIEDSFLENALLNKLSEFEVVGVEQNIETEYYQGRCDLILKKENELWVCDFKRGFKKAYLDHYLQLAAYKESVNADRVAIIGVPNVDFVELTNDKHELYNEILINLSKIYTLKNKI